jgi:hypothetical protein
MAKKNWIAGAIKNPGALTKQAQAARMTPMEFANKVGESNNNKYSTTTRRRAALARTLNSFRK